METNLKNLKIPSFARLKELLKRARSRTDSVLFTGPEPTLNKILPLAIRYAKEQGYTTVRLVSNGRLLSYLRYAQELLAAGLTELSLSFHGSRPEVHDALTRTPQSFTQTLQACRNLDRLKKRSPFIWDLNFTLTALNSHDLYDFFRLASGFRTVDSITVNSLIPFGRGLRYLRILVPDQTKIVKDLTSAIDRFEGRHGISLKERYNLRILGLPFCLLRGYEDFLNIYENILMVKGGHKIRLGARERSKRTKRPACRACRYDPLCEGVWSQYVRRKGWSEFIPVVMTETPGNAHDKPAS